MEQKYKMLIRARLKKKAPLKMDSEKIRAWLEKEEEKVFQQLLLQQLPLNPEIDPQLLMNFLEGEWEERMLIAQGLRYLDGEIYDLIEILLEDTEIPVLVAIVESIGEKKLVEFLPQILELKGRDSDLDVAIIEAMVLESSERILRFLECFLSSEDYKTSTTAMKVLHTQETSRNTIDLLLETLAHPNWSLRRLAVETLGRIENLEGIRRMMHFVDQENETVLNAMGEVADSQDEETRQILLAKSQEESTKPGATFLLGYIKGAEVIDRLLELLDDREELVRRYARKSLTRLGYETNWDIYFQGFEEKNWKSRLDLIENLKTLQNIENKINLIWKGLNDPYWAIGRESFRQLQQLSQSHSLSHSYLAKCLTLPDSWVRQKACREIGAQNLVRYKKELEQLKQDSDFLVRQEVTKVLISMQTSDSTAHKKTV